METFSPSDPYLPYLVKSSRVGRKHWTDGSNPKVVVDPAIGVRLGPGTQKVHLELSNDRWSSLRTVGLWTHGFLGIRLHAILIFA
jgi:hypothetical protein